MLARRSGTEDEGARGKVATLPAPTQSRRTRRGGEGDHHDHGFSLLPLSRSLTLPPSPTLLTPPQGYCQCPGSQTHCWPCDTHCPGTQVLIRWGGSSQCPATHCQPLFQVQYPGTQTDADEGGMPIVSWRSGGGGCGTIICDSRVTTGPVVGGTTTVSRSVGGASCLPPQATTRTRVIAARSASRISVRFIVCCSFRRPKTIASAPDARPSSGLAAPIAQASMRWCPGEVVPSVQSPIASRYSRPSIQTPRQTTATATVESFPPVAEGEAVTRRFGLRIAAWVLGGSEPSTPGVWCCPFPV
jgi:hypothetical protein